MSQIVLNSRNTAETYLWSSHVGKLETGVARVSKEELHVLCRQSSHHLLNYVQLHIESFVTCQALEELILLLFQQTSSFANFAI